MKLLLIDLAIRHAHRAIVPLLLLAPFCLTVLAAEDYSTWSYSKNITINTTNSGGGANVTSNVNNFPLLVRLNTANFSFTQAKAGGADIRFAKSNGTTHLPYQIERWQADSAEIWVLVDTVYGNSNSHYIIMYWGNAGAVDSSKGSLVFTALNGFEITNHLTRPTAKGFENSVADQYHGSNNVTASNDSNGTIGYGIRHNISNGTSPGDYILMNIPNPLDAVTFSIWIRPATLQANQYLFFFPGAYANWPPSGFYIHFWAGQMVIGCDSTDYAAGGNFLDGTTWHYVTATWNNTGSAIIYKNGVQFASFATAPGNFKWGGATNGTIGHWWGDNLDANVDEFRMENKQRSADWIKLSYENQKIGATMIALSGGGCVNPSISGNPRDTTVTAGSIASFRVSASGTTVTYQWQRFSGSWSDIAGGNSNVLTLTTAAGDSGAQFRCNVTACSQTITSTSATLTVLPAKPGPLTFTQNPLMGTVGVAIIPDTCLNSGGPADSFKVTPDLPGGLLLAKASGIINGTPLSKTALADYIIRAYNSAGTAQETFTVVVANPDDIINPLIISATKVDSAHVQLTLNNYSSLPSVADAFKPWADTVAVWYSSTSFPTMPNKAAPNMFAFNLASMKATAPTGPFITTVAVPVLPMAGDSVYYFSISVFWNNPDSVCNFIRAGGDSVLMKDTATPANPVVLSAVAASPTQIKLLWNRLTGVDSLAIAVDISPIPAGTPRIAAPTTFPFIYPAVTDTAYTVSLLNANTQYHFAAFAYVQGHWTKAVIASATTQQLSDTSRTPNSILIDSIWFDTATNEIVVKWHCDTSGSLYVYGAYVNLKSVIGTGQIPEPMVPINLADTVMVSRISLGYSIAFDTTYVVALYMKKTTQNWSLLTPTSIDSLHIPRAHWQYVRYFLPAETMVPVFNGSVQLLVPPGTTWSSGVIVDTLKVYRSTSIPGGFILASSGVSFTLAQGSQNFILSIKADTVPLGMASRLRMYQYSSTGQWVLCNSQSYDSVTQRVSALLSPRTDATTVLGYPFILMIDTTTAPDTIRVPVLIPISSPCYDRTPLFSWHALTFPVSAYTIQVDTNPSFTSTIINVQAGDTFYLCQAILSYDSIYWRVKADNFSFSTVSAFSLEDSTSQIPPIVRPLAPEGSCGRCGSGVGLALLPPIGFRLRTLLRRKKGTGKGIKLSGKAFSYKNSIQMVMLFMLFMIGISNSSQDTAKISIALNDLAGKGISQSEADIVSDRLRSELLNTGVFRVMERGQMDAILKEQGFQKSGACEEKSCLVDIGQLLGVDRMVAGTIGHVGNMYTMSLRMIHVGSGEILYTVNEDCRCRIEDVVGKSTRNIALKLANKGRPGKPEVAADRKTIPPPRPISKPALLCTLMVQTTPVGASVFVNNQNCGNSPYRNDTLKPAQYQIRLEADGYTAFQKEISLTAGGKMQLNVTLTPKPKIVPQEAVTEKKQEKTERLSFFAAGFYGHRFTSLFSGNGITLGAGLALKSFTLGLETNWTRFLPRNSLNGIYYKDFLGFSLFSGWRAIAIRNMFELDPGLVAEFGRLFNPEGNTTNVRVENHAGIVRFFPRLQTLLGYNGLYFSVGYSLILNSPISHRLDFGLIVRR